MKKILLFDVNETLLDLKALDSYFKKIFGDKNIRKQWFSQFIQSALVTIVTENYTPFGKIGAAALEMLAERQQIKLSEQDKVTILGKITDLQPYPEVSESLARLKENGFTIATLTNSTLEVAEKQLKSAKIIKYFDRILSADIIKKLKPAKEPYIWASKSFGVKIKDVMLIAAHSWDIAGALRVGCAAAFIARPGMVLDPLAPKPEIIGNNLTEVANQILWNFLKL